MSTALAYIAVSQLAKSEPRPPFIGPPVFMIVMLLFCFGFHLIFTHINSKLLEDKITDERATELRLYTLAVLIAIGVLVFWLCLKLDHPG
jgi:hypothetical protein